MTSLLLSLSLSSIPWCLSRSLPPPGFLFLSNLGVVLSLFRVYSVLAFLSRAVNATLKADGLTLTKRLSGINLKKKEKCRKSMWITGQWWWPVQYILTVTFPTIQPNKTDLNMTAEQYAIIACTLFWYSKWHLVENLIDVFVFPDLWFLWYYQLQICFTVLWKFWFFWKPLWTIYISAAF